MSTRTFFWDFVGPRSEQIARHHAKHVEEFLAREKLEGCEVGVEVPTPMRATAWCKAPEAVAEPIARALKPPRTS